MLCAFIILNIFIGGSETTHLEFRGKRYATSIVVFSSVLCVFLSLLFFGFCFSLLSLFYWCASFAMEMEGWFHWVVFLNQEKLRDLHALNIERRSD